ETRRHYPIRRRVGGTPLSVFPCCSCCFSDGYGACACGAASCGSCWGSVLTSYPRILTMRPGFFFSALCLGVFWGSLWHSARSWLAVPPTTCCVMPARSLLTPLLSPELWDLS